jgi:Pycsar effector protein
MREVSVEARMTQADECPGGDENERSESFEKILFADLQRVIEFLKYAEAKNGALLTFASAWVLATISLLSSDKLLPSGLGTVFAIVLPMFIFAAALSMISFFPRVDLGRFLGGKPAGPHAKNLLYFGDIASMTVLEFKQAVRERYFPSEGKKLTEAYLHDITIQIVVNSQITARKLRLFQYGLGLIAVALATLFFPIVGWAVHKFWGV